jgi:hypothetical protein
LAKVNHPHLNHRRFKPAYQLALGITMGAAG